MSVFLEFLLNYLLYPVRQFWDRHIGIPIKKRLKKTLGEYGADILVATLEGAIVLSIFIIIFFIILYFAK